MHERLRLELLRRIQRGTLSVSLLARQSGYGQSHLSNFLHGRRQLSLEAIDRLLAAQQLTPADLLPSPRLSALPLDSENDSAVPVVSHQTALNEPHIRPGAVQWMLPVRSQELRSFRARVAFQRRGWQRFVAILIPGAEALPMNPVLLPNALVLIDRHYNSLMAYNSLRPTLYAVRSGAQLAIRYLDFAAGRLILRPHNPDYPVELLEVDPEASPSDLILGRVAVIHNEL
jgi:transcriptional regulator with XRE-family HTH domain